MARFRRLLTIPFVLGCSLLLLGCDEEELPPVAKARSTSRASKNKAPRPAPRAAPSVSDDVPLDDVRLDDDDPRRDDDDPDPRDDEQGDPNRVTPTPGQVGPGEGEEKPVKKRRKITARLPGANAFAFKEQDGPNGKGERLGGRKESTRKVRLPPDTPMTVEQAIAAIKKAKGRIEKDDDGQVVKVFLNRTAIRDRDLRPVKYLPTIKVLNITGTKVSDAGLAYVKELTALEHFYPDGTSISDEGIADLKETLPKLIVLE